MRWRFRLWIIAGSLLLLTPSLAAAQRTLEEESEDLLADWDREQNLCFHPPDDPLPGYAYGAGYVEFDPLSADNATYHPGDAVTVTGVVRNSNPHYAFTNATLIYDVERENAAVRDAHWNDLVRRSTVALGTIPPGGAQPFTISWRIPASAPGGIYDVQTFVASDESPAHGGLSFVVNTGPTMRFSVEDGGDPAWAFFQRDSVTINGSLRGALRFPPPALPTDTPVRVGVTLAAMGTRPIAGTLEAEIYAWSAEDGNPPLHKTVEARTVVPGEPQTVTLTNVTLAPNAYEARFRFTPRDPHVPPSLLWDRFMVAGGVVPHVIFSGLVTNSSGESSVLTCAVNATEGTEGTTAEEEGTITTTIAVSPATVLEAPWWRRTLMRLARAATPNSLQARGVVRDGEVATTVIPVSGGALRNGINIQTVATDTKGRTTDSRTVAVPARLAAGRRPAPTGVRVSPSSVLSHSVLLVLVLVAGGLGIRLLLRQRRRS